MKLQGMQSLTLQGMQSLTVHEETFLRNFNKKFPQDKRRSASRLPLGRRSRAAFLRQGRPRLDASNGAGTKEAGDAKEA